MKKVKAKSCFATEINFANKHYEMCYNGRMKIEQMMDFFEEVEITEEYDGYYFSVQQAITIVVLGSLCGLKSIRQIHQWAESDSTRKLLEERFAIERIPCYYWLLCLLKMVKTDSLSRCITKWANSLLPSDRNGITVAVDGKTVRSTTKMKDYDNPLHIVSAQISELGITLGSQSVSGKSNEIPAVQELLSSLDIADCLVVADALNCQKDTAKAVVSGKADYLLSVKANQPALMSDIKDYIQNDELRTEMNSTSKTEKNRERIEKRTAFSTSDISWLPDKDAWEGIRCIGAIHTEFTVGKERTSEWHYYICSRLLSAEELLYHARKEWSVETMHWLLDVHFDEDYFRVANKTVQENMNLLRKFALSLVKRYKECSGSKRPLSQLMFDALLNPNRLLSLISEN